MQKLKGTLASLVFVAILSAASAICADALIRVLTFSTQMLQKNQVFLFLIPVVFFFTKFFEKKLSFEMLNGHEDFFKKMPIQIQNKPYQRASQAGLFVFVATVFSHFAGASVGREGSILQTSASAGLVLWQKIKDGFSRQPIEIKFFDKSITSTDVILISFSSGFSSALGLWFAGSVFAIELASRNKIKINLWQFVLFFISSVFSRVFGLVLQTPHFSLNQLQFSFSFELFAMAIVFGLSIGLLVILFVSLKKIFSNNTNKFFQNNSKQAQLLLIISCLALSWLLSWPAMHKYSSLGLNVIVQSFEQAQSYEVFLIKLIITAVFLGLGFRGGDFTPSVFIGTTFGSYFANHWAGALAHFNVTSDYLLSKQPRIVSSGAAIGFISFYCCLHLIPLTGLVVAAEMFSPQVGILSFVSILCGVGVKKIHGKIIKS